MNHNLLYDKIYRAFRQTEDWNKDFRNPKPYFSNDWTSQFAYFLNEELKKDYFVIPNNIKSLEDMLKFIDEKDIYE